MSPAMEPYTSINLQFKVRGEHEPKGIPEPQRLFAVRE